MEFLTESGIRVPNVTVEQMKEIDRISVEETGPNLFQMMENAGRNLTELTMKVLGKKPNKEILVLAGKGGNGGGGICAARHLSNKRYSVKVCVSDEEKLKVETEYQYHVLKSTNAEIISIDQLKNEKPDLIIDAIIGYSLNDEPKGKELALIMWANEQLAIKISLDVPSGVNATTGETSKHYIKPDITLTLALPKTGLLPDLTGELYLGDIGITKPTINKVIPSFNSIIFRDKYLIKIDYPD